MSDPNAQKVIEIKLLTGIDEIRESFKWVADLEKLKELSKRGPGRFYKIVAIHPMVTNPTAEPGQHPPRRWTAEELKKAARTLAGKPFNLVHRFPLNGHNVVIDAEYESDRLEELGYIEDSIIQKYIAEGKITQVSVQGEARSKPVKCEAGTCAETPEGVIFNATALVPNVDIEYNGMIIPAEPPGDAKSTIELMETLRPVCGHCSAAMSSSSSSTIGGHSADSSFRETSGHHETRMAEPSLDSILNTINGLQGVPADVRNQLAESVKQIHSKAASAGSGNVAEVATLKAELDGLKGQLNEIKTSIGGLKETLGSKMDAETLNKVVKEKVAEIKSEIAAATNGGSNGAGNPPNRGGSATLETLTEDQASVVLAAKIREMSLGDLMETVPGSVA